MLEEDRRLFPLTTIGGVLQLFRHQLTRDREPDIALLSIVAGCIENSMTSPRTSRATAQVTGQDLTLLYNTQLQDASCESDNKVDFEEPEVIYWIIVSCIGIFPGGRRGEPTFGAGSGAAHRGGSPR